MVIRVGVLGVGAIGAWHARIVAEGADELAAVCDTDLARAGAFGVPAFQDISAFLGEGLDAVIIATPEGSHEDHVRQVVTAGCAVLVEKPVAPDLASMRRIIDVVEASGVIAMAAHLERFEAGTAGLHQGLTQGICGQMSVVLARRQFGPAEVSRFAGLSSTLRVLGVHDFDLVRWLNPGPICSVQSMAGRGAIHAIHGMDDHVVTSVQFASGVVASIESGWTLPLDYQRFDTPQGWGAAGNNRLEVYGDKGFLSNDMSMRSQQLIAFDQKAGFRAAGLRHQPVVHGRVQGALRAEVEHFLDCVRRDVMPLVTMQDAARAVALLAAAETALASGSPAVPEM